MSFDPVDYDLNRYLAREEQAEREQEQIEAAASRQMHVRIPNVYRLLTRIQFAAKCGEIWPLSVEDMKSHFRDIESKAEQALSEFSEP